MLKLIQGFHQFQQSDFRPMQGLFEQLAHGQNPETLFITCSDSRIDPNLLTQSKPGDLFILRNAGNIIPPYGAANGGEGATIEFALVGLGIRDLIVCGHSHCGAMKGLLHPESLNKMPAVAKWLNHAEATRWLAMQKYTDLTEEDLLNVTIQENVLVQLENLRTHPAVATSLAAGKLKLHGWVYKLETGQVFAFEPESQQFLPLSEHTATAIPPSARLAAAHSI
jgi:carbonic anhydrase